MTSRSLLLLSAICAALPQTASAGELRLAVGGGGGVAAYDPCSYPGDQCSDPRTSTAGAAPLVLAGYRGRIALRRGWALRIGGTMSAVLIAPAAESTASVASGAGEFGVEYGRYAVDLIGGISMVRLSNDQMTGRGGTMLMGGSATVKMRRNLVPGKVTGAPLSSAQSFAMARVRCAELMGSRRTCGVSFVTSSVAAEASADWMSVRPSWSARR